MSLKWEPYTKHYFVDIIPERLKGVIEYSIFTNKHTLSVVLFDELTNQREKLGVYDSLDEAQFAFESWLDQALSIMITSPAPAISKDPL